MYKMLQNVLYKMLQNALHQNVLHKINNNQPVHHEHLQKCKMHFLMYFLYMMY